MMTRPFLCRSVFAGVLAAALLSLPAAASAQTGRLRGHVVDEEKKPVPDAVISLDFVGDLPGHYELRTDSKGEFVRVGLRPGKWRVTGKKGDLNGTFTASVPLGEAAEITLQLKAGAANAAAVEAAKLTPEEIKTKNKESQLLEDTFNAAKAALDAGNFDEALTKLEAMNTQTDKCAACYAKIGDIQSQKKENDKAEAAYKKALEIDPTMSSPYASLAAIYNEQKKFDEAAKMSAKANELIGAKGAGGDANSLYNQGVILWNQGKAVEAQPLFEQAITADPKMADAHYQLGMVLLNQGKMADCVKPFTEYLKLAPTGKNADDVKKLLAAIK